MPSFETYDWEGDEEWKSYVGSLTFPTDPPSQTLVDKFKRKYYKRNVDPNWGPNKGAESKSEPANVESPPQPQASQPHAPQTQSAAPAPPSAFARKIGIAGAYLQLIMHLTIPILSLFVLLPVVLPAGVAFYGILKISLMLQTAAVYRNNGAFSFSNWKEYMQRCAMDQEFQFLFYALVCYSASPIFLMVLPIVVRSAIFIARAFDQILPAYPSLASSILPRTRQISSRAQEFYVMAADFEIYVGIYTIVGVFLRTTGLLVVVFYWQYLRMRYMASPDTKRAFAVLRYKLDQLILSPTSYAPGIVKTGYQKVTGYMYSFVDPVQLQQAQQASSRCTIM